MNNKNIFAANLRRYMELNDKSRKDVCNDLGFNYNTYTDWVKGKKYPRMDKVEMLANYFGILKSDLIEEKDSKERVAEIPTATNIIPMPEAKSIPLVGKIACGTPITATENLEGYIKIPAQLEADFALVCRGDSMVGARIMDGDFVAIRQQPDVDDGDIAAVLIEDEATLKRVYKMPGRLVLRAENPCYAPIDLSGAELDDVRILGKVVYFISKVN